MAHYGPLTNRLPQLPGAIGKGNVVQRVLSRFEQNRTSQLLLLLLVLAIAAALRLYKLGEWSFWGDEWITVRRSLTLFEEGLRRTSFSLIVTRGFLSFLGVDEWSARLAAAVVGIASIPLVYALATRAFDRRVALVAILLLAISPWHIYWSQNARFYTTLLLFFTLSLFFFYFGLEEDRPSLLILSLVFLGLAVQERLIAAFLGPITAGYVVLLILLRFPKPSGLRFRNLALFFGPGIVAALAVVYETFFLRVARWENAFTFVNNNPFWLLGGVVFYVGIPVTCLSVAGALYLLQQKNRAGLLLALASIIPLGGVLILSFMQFTANRYVFVSLTSLIILASVAVIELIRHVDKGKYLAFAVLAIVLLGGLGDNLLYYRYQHGNRDNWRDAFALIERRAEAGDMIITTHRELADYYLGQSTVGMQSLDLSTVQDGSRRAWFILDLTAPDKVPEVFNWVQQNGRPIANFDVTVTARTFPMRIYLYDPGDT